MTATTLARPVTLPVNAENLPDQLKTRCQWLVWSYVWTKGADDKPGKWDKPPVNAKDNTPGSSTNRNTWSSFDDSIGALVWNHHDGIGFAVTFDDPFYVVDLDHCFTDGELLPMARSIVNRTRDSLYWERSPSGEGLRGVGIGTFPGHRKKNDVFEVYSTGRYITMTGHVFDGCDRIGGDSTGIITEIHREQFGHAPPERTRARQSDVSPADDLDIVASLQGMANGAAFERLMQGSTADYGGDDSRADAALIERLLWRTGGDIEQAVRIASTSGLWRPKWETKRGDTDYLRYTAEHILDKMTDFYDPNHGRPVRTWMGTLSETSYPPAHTQFSVDEPVRFVAVKVGG